MKRLFYFVITAIISAGAITLYIPGREVAAQWLAVILGFLLLLFGGKDLCLFWLTFRAEQASKRGNRIAVKKNY